MNLILILDHYRPFLQPQYNFYFWRAFNFCDFKVTALTYTSSICENTGFDLPVIYDSVLKRENTGKCKTRILGYFMQYYENLMLQFLIQFFFFFEICFPVCDDKINVRGASFNKSCFFVKSSELKESAKNCECLFFCSNGRISK